ncbi:MAG: hypothetical protein ACC645_22230, partial [Pirellulales bacterium]
MEYHPPREQVPSAADRSALIWLMIAAGLLEAIYLAVAILSRYFGEATPGYERPIVAVVGLLVGATCVYLMAQRLALQLPQRGHLLVILLGAALLFRLTLLPSQPIQEVDIYRYLWDGAATSSGVSPFRYSPKQVVAAHQAVVDDRAISLPDDLRKLAERCQQSPALAWIVRQVHYAELPTIYPPVSQAVFALTALAMPDWVTLQGRLLVMKGVLVLFDLGTVVLIIYLLRVSGMHIGWVVAYAWSPLVMKEVAGSGHLDAIAVFFTTLAIVLVCRDLFLPHRLGNADRSMRHGRFFCGPAISAAAVLALAVGAKLYPIVLAPWILLAIGRRRGAAAAVVPGLVFSLLTVVLLFPMLPYSKTDRAVEARRTDSRIPDVADPRPPLPEEVAPFAANDPSLGLMTFLRRWEMNDLLFMIVRENLRPDRQLPPGERAWFSIVPAHWRAAVTEPVERACGLTPAGAAFLVTRLLTGFVFLVIAAWLALAPSDREPTAFLRAGFLTLAWFWLLAPTQNPWYWVWAMPLVAFARSRAWLAVGGLVLLYYLRFYFAYQWPDQPIAGGPYAGACFYDYVVPWLEFGPWLVYLPVETAMRRR